MSSVILKEAKKQGVKVRIAHSHNTNMDRDLKYPIRLFYRSLIPYCANYRMACSEEAGKWLFRNYSFSVLKNAIDAAAFTYDEDIRLRMRHQMGIKDGELVVGHVGRFSPPKKSSLSPKGF